MAAEQESTKEANIFALQNNFHKLVLHFDVECENDEALSALQTYLKSNQSISAHYLVNNKKSLIVVCKDKKDKEEVEKYSLEFKEGKLTTKSLPHSSFTGVLVAEINDHKFKRLSPDKSTAMKMIESQTGLKLKKQKKAFYYCGLLYQFTLLDELFAAHPSTEEEPDVEPLPQTPAATPSTSSASLTTVKKDDNPNAIVNEKIEFDKDLINYYRKWHDKEFDKLKTDFGVKDIYVTTQKSSANVVFHFSIEKSKSDETKAKLLQAFNDLKTNKLKEVELRFANYYRDFNIIDDMLNDDNCDRWKIILSNANNNKCKLYGLEENIKKLFEANSKYIQVVQDKFVPIIWSVNMKPEVGGTKENNNPSTPTKSTITSTNESHPTTPKLSITIKNDNNKRVVISDKESETQFLKAKSGFCLICQTEEDLYKKCTNPQCDGAFCQNCWKMRNKPSKCAKCKWDLNGSSDIEPSSASAGIKDGRLSITTIDEPCLGYEKFKTYKITFQFDDGIQKETDPEPGKSYFGTTKYAFIPAINESKELLDLLKKAFNNGLLFHVNFNRSRNGYQVFISPDILLKTDTQGHHRFGYPDRHYVTDTIKSLKIMLNQ